MSSPSQAQDVRQHGTLFLLFFFRPAGRKKNSQGIKIRAARKLKPKVQT
jgi:hypothetical protein